MISTNWEKYRDDAIRCVREKGMIPICVEIRPELAAIVTECIFEAILKKIKNITVLIDTSGGDAKAGNSIANTISLAASNGVHITGVVLSKASSAGFLILQACSLRVACRGACVMMHWGQTMLQNDDIAAIMRGEEDWVLEQIRGSQQEMLALLAKRSVLDEDKIRQMCDREVSLSAQKALELHLIDQITYARDFTITMPKEKEE